MGCGVHSLNVPELKPFFSLLVFFNNSMYCHLLEDKGIGKANRHAQQHEYRKGNAHCIPKPDDDHYDRRRYSKKQNSEKNPRYLFSFATSSSEVIL